MGEPYSEHRRTDILAPADLVGLPGRMFPGGSPEPVTGPAPPIA